MDTPSSIALLVLQLMITIILHQAVHRSYAVLDHDHHLDQSCSSSCGNLHNITYPFRLETDPPTCGSQFHGFHLSCKKNRTIFNIRNEKYNVNEEYHVQTINYHNYTIRVVSSNVEKGNCASIPSSSLSARDIPWIYSYSIKVVSSNVRTDHYIPMALKFLTCEKDDCSSIPFYTSSKSVFGIFVLDVKANPKFETEIRLGRNEERRQISETITFLSCGKPVLNNPSYIDTSPCINSSAFSAKNKGNNYSYVLYGNGFKFSDMEESCQVYHKAVVPSRKGDARKKITSYEDIHNELSYGFELSWVQIFQEGSRDRCYVDEKRSNNVYCLSNGFCSSQFCRLLVQRLLAAPLLIALIVYMWKRRHKSEYGGIEAFLQSPNNLMPIRYTYSEVRKMAQGFKTKLGEGGFGSVYKGKLRSGRFVAIKILGKSKSSGQDFMNEVATIGRIHHHNVVRLIGFCVEGSKRALICDFMPNGSLEKYIFSGGEISNSISFEKTFEISLGIARGIEYLHRGCDMQILHFDIKPHNILLDENFIPKVSDFGLAKLCPLDNSIVSMTAARGTIGYIAPELFYKNIGGVSYKADVYSFGKLLTEMANKRSNANANANAEDSSEETYFPLWIYDQISKGKDVEIEDATEEELKTVKKMIIVALWCIQLKPCDRPSMNKVIDMLEAEFESLQMPPRPYLYPQDDHNNAGEALETSNTESSSTNPEEDSPEISFISNAHQGLVSFQAWDR
ncbi:putative receptor-like protein kinase [Morus notabilis]|uniref:Putative receptor-like protein kinase n=1 Tax=Morus notabilis TaxID=981085 RepID=W9RBK2_9ROSA|nr:putative receptor-like protein kinase [Morus notabilis]